MIDFSSTVVELSGDSEKQKEVQDIAKCLRTLYSTPIGSQEGDRELGINPNIFVDKPLPVAKGLYVAEVTEKTASFEPRARVVRVDWLDSDVLHGVVIPKVVYDAAARYAHQDVNVVIMVSRAQSGAPTIQELKMLRVTVIGNIVQPDNIRSNIHPCLKCISVSYFKFVGLNRSAR